MDPLVGVVLVMVALAAGVLARVGAPPWTRGAHGHGDGRDDQARLQPIADTAALDPLFAAGRAAPAVLFLHDPGCPISRAAYRQVMRLDHDIPLIDVRRAHGLSRDVEERTGVRHESPQVIVLRQGRAVWSTSHHGITTRAVADALRQACGEAS